MLDPCWQIHQNQAPLKATFFELKANSTGLRRLHQATGSKSSNTPCRWSRQMPPFDLSSSRALSPQALTPRALTPQALTPNWDASVAQSLPPLSPANRPDKKKSSVIDSRQQFLRRYLTHRHSWHPPAPLIAEALLRSGYSDLL